MHRIFRVWFDLFAQAADININASRGDETIRAPDSVKQLILVNTRFGREAR